MRVQLILEAISIAHQFTKDRQAARLGQVVTVAENWEVRDHMLTEEQLTSLKDAVIQMSSAMANDLSSTMRASGVIFAHSSLDNVLNRILTLAVLVDPGTWKQEIHKACTKLYSLEELNKLDRLKIMADAKKQFVARAKHLSIAKRNEMLLRHIGPYAKNLHVERMNTQDLKSFDLTRHELIHANALIHTKTDEVTIGQCAEVIDHAENLIRSLAEYGGLPAGEVDDLLI